MPRYYPFGQAEGKHSFESEEAYYRELEGFLVEKMTAENPDFDIETVVVKFSRTLNGFVQEWLAHPNHLGREYLSRTMELRKSIAQTTLNRLHRFRTEHPTRPRSKPKPSSKRGPSSNPPLSKFRRRR